MDNAKTAFEELNRLLAENQMTLSVICVGGFVLEHHGLRATQDIDDFTKKRKRQENSSLKSEQNTPLIQMSYG